MSEEVLVSLKLKEVMRRTTLGKSTVYLKIKQNVFPSQHQLTDGRVGWYEHEIQEWLETRPDRKKCEKK
jgi:prophage regulatory protein